MNMRVQMGVGAVFTSVLMAIFIALTASIALQAKGLSRDGPESVQVEHSKTYRPIVITVDSVGVVGRCGVGVISVSNTHSAKKVTLAMWTLSPNVDAQYKMDATEGGLVPCNDGLHKILWIVPSKDKQRGRVGISSKANPLKSLPGPVLVYLAQDGRLRFFGSSLKGQSDIDIYLTAWNTFQTPASVEVKSMPTPQSDKDINPKDIKYAHLEVGSRLTIGSQELTVLAIEPKTTEHPLWVVFVVESS